MKYFLAFFLAVASVGAHAAYKWVDNEGRVHYTDDPPPAGVQAKTLQAPGAPSGQNSQPASGVSGEKSIYQQAAEVDKQRKAQAEADKKAAEKQQQEEREQQACNNARSNLSTLQNAPRISTYDAQGNKVYLDDQGRKQQEEQAQRDIDKYCK